jgi:hypothetical protein
VRLVGQTSSTVAWPSRDVRVSPPTHASATSDDTVGDAWARRVVGGAARPQAAAMHLLAIAQWLYAPCPPLHTRDANQLKLLFAAQLELNGPTVLDCCDQCEVDVKEARR